jgi:uracil-DNA glycosylase family 4
MDVAERGSLMRQMRHRLESLQRAGLEQIPAPSWHAAPTRPAPAPAPKAEAPPPPPAPAAPAPAPFMLTAPKPAPTSIRGPASVGSLFAESGFPTAPLPSEERPALLQALEQEVAACQRCPALVASRTRTVFGIGNPDTRLMFVGEAPGEDEDRQGIPFVGRAGQLLTDMITKGMGLTRDQIYIANACKCRPTDEMRKNRPPDLQEVANCRGYLDRQIEIIRPKFLLLLGKSAATSLLDTALPMGRLRQKWFRYKGIPTLVTYHPSYLLRNPAGKKDAWDDLKMLMQAMGLKAPGRGS